MIRRKTLYVFLADKTTWFWFAGRRRCLKPASTSLSVEQILEHCREYNASLVVLFLEFPWVLTHFEVTIPLSPDELPAYAQMRLDFPKHDKQENSTTSAQAKSSTPEQQVGGMYCKQNNPEALGVLCASLSKNAIQLQNRLKQELRFSVERVPLVAACLPLLLKKFENSLIFKGLEQSYLLEKKDNCLTKLLELPNLENSVQRHFVTDHLPLKEEAQTLRLLPELKNTQLTENGNSANEKTTSLDDSPSEGQTQNLDLAMEAVLSEWKGLSLSPRSGFWWSAYGSKKRDQSFNLRRLVAVIVVFVTILGAGGFYYQFLRQGQVLRQELAGLEQELEEQIPTTKQHSGGHEEHLEQWEKLAKELVQKAFWKEQALRIIFSSLEGAWIENLTLKKQKMQLELLALKPVHAVDVFLRLSKIPETAKVRLKSQQSAILRGHNVIRFVLKIELPPPAKIQNQKLKTQN